MEPSSVAVLVTYCVLILFASLAGGAVPLLLRLTHRRMELLVSFVSGVMLGVAILAQPPVALPAMISMRPRRSFCSSMRQAISVRLRSASLRETRASG